MVQVKDNGPVVCRFISQDWQILKFCKVSLHLSESAQKEKLTGKCEQSEGATNKKSYQWVWSLYSQLENYSQLKKNCISSVRSKCFTQPTLKETQLSIIWEIPISPICNILGILTGTIAERHFWNTRNGIFNMYMGYFLHKLSNVNICNSQHVQYCQPNWAKIEPRSRRCHSKMCATITYSIFPLFVQQ